MSYTINHTDSTIVNNDPIIVDDNTTNIVTNLAFPGRNQRGYSESIGENFLRLLENFASSDPPNQTIGGTPVVGQLWFDNTDSIKELKVFDGTTWKSAGSVKKKSSQPTDAILGDLWTDTINQQLYLYSGQSWILVGPNYSSNNGLKNGVFPEIIESADLNNTQYNVIKTYVNDKVLSIFSAYGFLPKVAIDGFTEIKPGLNLSRTSLDSNYSSKVWGTSEKAESLIVGSDVVSSSKFMRIDQPNVTSFRMTINNNSGLTIGNTGQLNLRINNNSSSGTLYHATPDSSFDFNLNVNTAETTLIHLDSSGYVGIGINNNTPGYSLDVKGTGSFTDDVIISSTTDVLNGGALSVTGGVIVGKSLTVTNDLSVGNDLTVTGSGNFTGNINGNLKGNIISANNNTTILDTSGTIATFKGNVNGTLTGTATSLSTITQFSITGDVSASVVNFNGSNNVVLSSHISTDLINNKAEILSTVDTDSFLMYRKNSNVLNKVTKKTIIGDLPIIQPGMILPYAGLIPPTGYLLCDGSAINIGTYPDLYDILLDRFNGSLPLESPLTFRLPDLRGRFPLGSFDMFNSNPLFSHTTLSDGDLSRATGSNAKTVGNAGGLQQKTLNVNELPQHQHSLKGKTSNNQFYGIRDSSDSPSDVNATTGKGLNASTQAQFLSDSGNVISDTIGQPFNLMNPFLTINYIIYVGRIIS